MAVGVTTACFYPYMQSMANQRPYFFDHIEAIIDQGMDEFYELIGRYHRATDHDVDDVSRQLRRLGMGNRTTCGDCVTVCPKNLFSLQPISNRLWVACRNRKFGDDAEAECEAICTACGHCEQDSPEGLIDISDNLMCID